MKGDALVYASVQDLANELGVSRSIIYRIIRQYNIRYVKPKREKVVLIPEDEIERIKQILEEEAAKKLQPTFKILVRPSGKYMYRYDRETQKWVYIGPYIDIEVVTQRLEKLLNQGYFEILATEGDINFILKILGKLLTNRVIEVLAQKYTHSIGGKRKTQSAYNMAKSVLTRIATII